MLKMYTYQLAVHSYAVWPLQCSSNIRNTDGIQIAGPHKGCLVYLDDVIVVGTFHKQLHDLRKVFQRY
jgi:hypothetical protein